MAEPALAAADLAADDSLWTAIARVCAGHGDRVALRHRAGDRWHAVTYEQLAALVGRSAAHLSRGGLRAGDRIVVLGDTSLEWVVTDLAALSVGAIVVPIFPTSSVEQVEHIVASVEPVLGFADTAARRGVLEAAGVPTAVDAADRAGAGTPAPTAGDVATIVFTSGTTGVPKGCVLTHRNVYCAAANVSAAVREVFVRPGGVPSRTVVALPLSHMYGFSTLVATLLAGGEAVLTAAPSELGEAMNHRPPTFLALTPYLLQKVERIAGESDAAVSSLEYVICGGASLSPESHDSFLRRGITVLGAYGMTETGSAAAINRPRANRIGTVGLPNPGTTITVDEDGELILTGANVSPGYWGEIDPANSGNGPHSVRTGDLGLVDGDGFVRITGRRKEILVTSSGKNVAPAPLEDRVRVHPLVEACIVVGERRPFVAALIAVDKTARAGLSDAEVRQALQSAVDAANTLVSRAESIRKFGLLTTGFSVESGHLTTSGKLVRAKILADYAKEIDALYR